MNDFRKRNSTKYLADYFGFTNYNDFVNLVIRKSKYIGNVHYDLKDSNIARLDDSQTVYLVVILADEGVEKAQKLISNWCGYLMSKAKYQAHMPLNLTK